MSDPLTPVLPSPAGPLDNDMPISEVVALTEVKIETPPTPSVASQPLAEAPKSPLFEDPDEIVVKRTL
jgi:hypothetical protein